MEAKLQNLEARVRQLEANVGALIQQFLPPVIKRLEALEQQNVATSSDTSKVPKVRTRKSLDYDTYRAVQRRIQAHDMPKAIADDLGIPYSTVRVYASLSEDRVQGLLDKKRVAEARLLRETAKKAAKLAKEKNEALLDHERAEAAAANSEELAKSMSGTPVGDSETGSVVPEISRAEASMAVQTPPCPEGEISDVPCEPSALQAGYIVECPRVALNNELSEWYEWPAQYKAYAAERKAADGYPLYPPVQREAAVGIWYMNGTMEIHKAVDVDWGPSGGVFRWKLVTA